MPHIWESSKRAETRDNHDGAHDEFYDERVDTICTYCPSRIPKRDLPGIISLSEYQHSLNRALNKKRKVQGQKKLSSSSLEKVFSGPIPVLKMH